jgi:DnaK suppressor protein
MTAMTMPDARTQNDVAVDDYVPHADEPFMNDRQREYFRRKLIEWKTSLLNDSKDTITHLQTETASLPDVADRASAETDKNIELRIDDGSYGYCDDTGEPISLGRLMARPVATLSLEAQERHERAERIHRDD